MSMPTAIWEKPRERAKYSWTTEDHGGLVSVNAYVYSPVCNPTIHWDMCSLVDVNSEHGADESRPDNQW